LRFFPLAMSCRGLSNLVMSPSSATIVVATISATPGKHE
jgi:hypothetical protein